VEPEMFAEYELRARDLFTQQVCRAKLDLAIRAGITQENQTIPAEAFSRSWTSRQGPEPMQSVRRS